MDNNINNNNNQLAQQFISTFFSGCLTWLVIFMALLLCVLFGSCTSPRTVVVETVRTDTVRLTQYERDSIVMSDSIFVRERQNGDTVFLEVTRMKNVFRDRWKHDSIYVARRCSIPVPYPVEKPVEKKLSKWQKMRMGIGDVVLVSAVAVAAAWLLKKRFSKRSLLQRP